MRSGSEEGAMWVRCRGFDGGDLYINLNTVTLIRPEGGGSRVFFAGEADDHVTVQETPTLILEQARVFYTA